MPAMAPTLRRGAPDLHLGVREAHSHKLRFEPAHEACRRKLRRRIIRRRRAAAGGVRRGSDPLAAIGTLT
jgi:hypothetical protein